MKIKKNLNEASVVDAAQRDAVKEIEKTADRLNADDNVSWEPDSMESELEDAYRANISKKKKEQRGRKVDAWNNVLLVGGAGVGKTARVFQWAEKHPNIRVEVVDAKTLDPADLGGAVAPDRATGTRAVRLSTDEFNRLDSYEGEDKFVVLFLDELNRAASDVRGSLLTLVNNHQIPDSSVTGGLRTLNGLLFTVAAINPADGSYNTDQLDAAEKSRFKRVNVMADNRSLLKHLLGVYKQDLADAQEDGDEREYNAVKGRMEIARKLLSDPMFQFDNDKEIADASDNDTQILVPRNLTLLLDECDGTKSSFLRNWDKYCNPTKRGVVENILKDYKDVDNKANSVFKTGAQRLYGKQADQGQDASIFQKKEPSAFDKFAKYKKDNDIEFVER